MLKKSQTAVADLMYDDIGSYLLLEETDLTTADAVIVFGNKHIIDQAAEKAVELYENGMARLVVFTGARDISPGFIEAEAMASLVNGRIPPENILIDTESTNTPENVRSAKSLIRGTYPDMNVGSVIAVGNVCAGRRFLMTLKKQWPEVFAMASNVNPFSVGVSEWHTCPRFQAIVMSEFDKIKPYVDKGDIAEIDIDAINKRVKTLQTAPQNRATLRT
ncbi:MAG: YdcF family protein [Pseudomonadota bacterium]